MNRFFRIIVITTLVAVCSLSLLAQVDEVSDATGMPIAIGAPVIYGQVAIEGIPKGERRPSIFVSLLSGGSQLERRQADSRGYFFFMQNPRHGV